jgi:DNA-binding transcriptional ArsR family regulator
MPRSRSAARALAASAPLFSALGDETRLRLVGRLSDGGPASIATLTSGSDVTRQAIAKHLRILEDAGLVRGTRDGRESVWELRVSGLGDARRSLEAIATQWEAALGRLKVFVERCETRPTRGSSKGT